jgi:tetratricopeptide (TPR) repeat protein
MRDTFPRPKWSSSILIVGLLLTGCVTSHLSYQKGNELLERRDYAAALTQFSTALELDPRLTAAYLKRGLCHQRVGQYEKALADFNKCVELSPNNEQVYVSRATFYDEQGDHRQLALKDLDKAIELNSGSAYNYNLRGNIYLKLLQFEKAIEDYTKSIERNSRDVVPYCGRGNAYLELRNLKKPSKTMIRLSKLTRSTPWPGQVEGMLTPSSASARKRWRTAKKRFDSIHFWDLPF